MYTHSASLLREDDKKERADHEDAAYGTQAYHLARGQGMNYYTLLDHVCDMVHKLRVNDCML